MTVCIAAISNDNRRVTVSDTKLTVSYYSQDLVAIKQRSIHKYWKALIAGKFSQQQPLIEEIHNKLSQSDKPSLSEVERACTNTYIEAAKKLATESVLSKYGLDVDSFLKSREIVGDSIYERVWGEISRVRLSCDLLVCGFDGLGKPHIIIVSNPTEDNPSFITHCDDVGFGTIGTGSFAAESTLYAFSQSSVDGLAETIYKTTAAKFVAEAASDVGEATFLYVWDATGEQFGSIGLDLIGPLRTWWKTKGRPRLPEKFIKHIREKLNKLEQKEA